VANSNTVASNNKVVSSITVANKVRTVHTHSIS
jgi:hypothetical protein